MSNFDRTQKSEKLVEIDSFLSFHRIFLTLKILKQKKFFI